MMPSITLTVRFDKELQKLTHRSEHPVVMSTGSMFAFLLSSILIEYPEIAKLYPPGTLGFDVNGIAPGVRDLLSHGDIVTFFVSEQGVR